MQGNGKMNREEVRSYLEWMVNLSNRNARLVLYRLRDGVRDFGTPNGIGPGNEKLCALSKVLREKWNKRKLFQTTDTNAYDSYCSLLRSMPDQYMGVDREELRTRWYPITVIEEGNQREFVENQETEFETILRFLELYDEKTLINNLRDFHNFAGNLEDSLSSERLLKVVDPLKNRIKRTDPPAFFINYLFTDTDTFRTVTDYFAEQLGIEGSHVKEFSQPGNVPISRHEFLNNPKNGLLIGTGNGLYLVREYGFERAFVKSDSDVHHLDQSLKTGQERVLKQKQKVVLFSQVGDSLGPKRYELTLKSVLNSQHRDEVYAI